MQKNIYLSISGFLFLIKFGRTSREFTRSIIRRAILNLYSGFITSKPQRKIDYAITFMETQKIDIIHQKWKKNYINFYEDDEKGHVVTFYYISMHEFGLMLRNIIQRLLLYHNGFMLHASASDVEGQAYVFMGKNGAGKSTLIKALNSKYPALADDSGIIRLHGKNVYFYQTSLFDKEEWIQKKSQRFQMGKFFFLRKAKFYKIEKIQDKNLILSYFIKQLWLQDGNKVTAQINKMVDTIRLNSKFYFLYFAKNPVEVLNLITACTRS